MELKNLEGFMAAPVLQISNLTFERLERVVLTDLNFTLQPGEMAAVVGANGCGKSTLLRLIAGYLWPTSGVIRLFGYAFGEYPMQPLRERLALVEASSTYPFDDEITAGEVVLTGFFSSLTLHYHTPSDAQKRRGAEALKEVGLPDRGDQLYHFMSTGQRMKTLLARALVKRPELLLLDEPTGGLDLPTRETVLATLAALHNKPQAPAMIMVTHHLEELLPSTENVLLLSLEGKTVAQGHPEAVLTAENMTAAYRFPIHINRLHERFYATVDPRAWPHLTEPL